MSGRVRTEGMSGRYVIKSWERKGLQEELGGDGMSGGLRQERISERAGRGRDVRKG